MPNPDFYKGMPKVPGSGRKPGSKNKPRTVREVLMQAGISLPELCLDAIDDIQKPEKRAEMILKLMEYAYPKMKGWDHWDAWTSDDDTQEELAEQIAENERKLAEITSQYNAA